MVVVEEEEVEEEEILNQLSTVLILYNTLYFYISNDNALAKFQYDSV